MSGYRGQGTNDPYMHTLALPLNLDLCSLYFSAKTIQKLADELEEVCVCGTLPVFRNLLEESFGDFFV